MCLCVCFFLRSVTAGGRVGPFVLDEEPLLRTRGMIVSRGVYCKAPKGQLHSTPIAVSGFWPHQKIHQFIDAAVHVQGRLTSGSYFGGPIVNRTYGTHKYLYTSLFLLKKNTVAPRNSRMQLALHATR